MDWKEIGAKVASIGLPVLGTALGGPAGGVVGKLAASALGLSENASAEDVAQAIDSGGGEAVAKLRELQEKHRHEIERLTIEAETARIAEANKTMRVEANAEDSWTRRWRPFWGFASGFAWSAMACAIAWSIATGNSSGVISELSGIPETFWLIPLTVLGVASWHRGKKQRVEAGEQSTGSVAQKLSKKWFG